MRAGVDDRPAEFVRSARHGLSIAGRADRRGTPEDGGRAGARIFLATGTLRRAYRPAPARREDRDTNAPTSSTSPRRRQRRSTPSSAAVIGPARSMRSSCCGSLCPCRSSRREIVFTRSASRGGHARFSGSMTTTWPRTRNPLICLSPSGQRAVASRRRPVLRRALRFTGLSRRDVQVSGKPCAVDEGDQDASLRRTSHSDAGSVVVVIPGPPALHVRTVEARSPLSAPRHCLHRL